MDNIKDWNTYRRATVISTSPTIEPKRMEQELIELLKSGNIEEFNKKAVSEFVSLNLRGVDLSKSKIECANLTYAYLTLSLLIMIKDFQSLQINGTKFKKTLTNSSEFVKYIKKQDKSNTVKQIDKIELEEVMIEMRHYERGKEHIRDLKPPLFLISN